MAWSQGLEEAARKKQEGRQMEWETRTHWVSMICWSCWLAAARKIILSTPASKAGWGWLGETNYEMTRLTT